MPTTVRVVPVRDHREFQHFLKLPWRIYRNDPFWVPPLLFDQKQLLNRRKHPFHQHAEVEYFVAWHGEEVVGRIAAIVNHQYVQFHEEKTGFFGFFESIDDVEVVTALLATAEQWVANRGMQQIRGPMNFSTNEECALLIDGFDSSPAVMMPYNPTYYPQLVEGSGYAKEKDLLAYLVDGNFPPPPRLVNGAERLLRRQNIVIRPFNLKRFKQEVESLTAIYQSAWERNWGFVPMTQAEVDNFADQMWWVANPNLCLLAELDGEAIGFALALPDYNYVLRHMNGRLFPFGLLKFLWYRRKISTARTLILGLKPGFRRRGVDAMLYLRLWQEAPRNGYPLVECSWILEDNWDMRRALERMGGRLYKTYRVYEKKLTHSENRV